MPASGYPSDLSDSQWKLIEEFFIHDPKKGGRPPLHPRKHIFNAIMYVAKTGCQWRFLPIDFPPWKTVYLQYRRWMQKGVLDRVYQKLYSKERERQGRPHRPSAGIIDSQSVKTVEKGGFADLMVVRK